MSNWCQWRLKTNFLFENARPGDSSPGPFIPCCRTNITFAIRKIANIIVNCNGIGQKLTERNYRRNWAKLAPVAAENEFFVRERTAWGFFPGPLYSQSGETQSKNILLTDSTYARLSKRPGDSSLGIINATERKRLCNESTDFFDSQSFNFVCAKR